MALTVRLTPKGGRDAIDGIEIMADGRAVLKTRVRAAPSGGKANDALIRTIAKAVGVAARDVTLAGGTASRLKRLSIKGDTATLTAALERLSGAG